MADATQVVLMRKGTRTVLSMQNNYKGPVEAFAMVIPVPTVLKEADVKTLPKDVFVNVERMGAPHRAGGDRRAGHLHVLDALDHARVLFPVLDEARRTHALDVDEHVLR